MDTLSADNVQFANIRPLPPAEVDMPTLTTEMLPSELRDWIADIAERMQVPLEMVAVPALTALSSVIGRRMGIYPMAKNDWLVVPNLWAMVVARPGRMKSPAMKEALEPINALEANARRGILARQAEHDKLLEKENDLRERRGHHQENTAAIHAELKAIRQTIENFDLSSDPTRYIVNDATVEKLAEMLRDNPGGLLLLRDEIAGWLQGLSRSDRKGDRELYLETWDGRGTLRVDRIGRGSVYVSAMCLSVLGGIQPEKLESLVLEAIDGGKGADGLIQRFQLLVWPSENREWRHVDRLPNRVARQRVYEIFDALSRLPLPDGDDVPGLRFSDEAQKAFDDWRCGLEKRLTSGEFEQHPAYEGHISKYRSLMPSLALIFHLLGLKDCQRTTVSLSAANLAIKWCEYLECHARRLYTPELRKDLLAAHALAKKIQAGVIATGTTIRDIYTSGWSGLSKSQSVLDGLQILEEFGWVRVETVKKGVGRPGKVITLHPEFDSKSLWPPSK